MILSEAWNLLKVIAMTVKEIVAALGYDPKCSAISVRKQPRAPDALSEVLNVLKDKFGIGTISTV